jgi:putative tryptophan/tyrosine transport system substrate-binding protein
VGGRRFIALLGGVALAWPLELRAQQPGRMYRLGGLGNLPCCLPNMVALLDELRHHGFVEGQNLTFDPADTDCAWTSSRKPPSSWAKTPVNVILAFTGNHAIHAAQQATATIPILGMTDDMVGSGLVSSMADPGGNTTGLSLLAAELVGKRQELFIELILDVRHIIAALADANRTPLGSSRH